MIPDGLLNIVKQYMSLTWLDGATDARLQLIVQNGIVDLDEKSGVKNNYVVSGRAQSLLLIRTMYEWSNALDDFYTNYKKEIVAFINMAKVSAYVNEQTSN